MMVRQAGTDFLNFLSLTQDFSAAVLSISQAWVEGSLLDTAGGGGHGAVILPHNC